MGEREAREEDKVVKCKGGRAEYSDAVIKKPYPLFTFKGFWETAPY